MSELRPKTSRLAARTEGMLYQPRFLTPEDRAELVAWLGRIRPLWESRYAARHPLREGQVHRRLLRPVYWLGTWQFACLGYYHPPQGALNRCVLAEPFPPVLQRFTRRVEALAHELFAPADVPPGWTLNSCLINLYGLTRRGEQWVDTARVGEHKDFEPGPVASLSLGEKALFQFVETRDAEEDVGLVAEQWLEDGSLQLFGGPRWKSDHFHRVDRVMRRGGSHHFDLAVEDFVARRINFTFRFVPPEHHVRFANLPPLSREDVEPYVRTLAQGSAFFAAELAVAGTLPPATGER